MWGILTLYCWTHHYKRLSEAQMHSMILNATQYLHDSINSGSNWENRNMFKYSYI
ncbi:hypothetical protein BDZ91DRAFT_713466 [Kalaharituber pfeilii]|nr:hypothetical protein BDZ91DRAFT_713466 [Kalaharituber pfeilii]